jgi:hypothetical protein
MSEENDDRRGTIKYPERYIQSKLISYQGMVRIRNITPTDIDGLIDYNGNVFVYLEGKLIGKDLDYGQRLCFEHLVQSHEKAGNFSWVLVFEFNEPVTEIIIAKNKFVREIYESKRLKWRPPEKKITLIEAIEEIENYCTKRGIQI